MTLAAEIAAIVAAVASLVTAVAGMILVIKWKGNNGKTTGAGRRTLP